jgi:probable rRNA maturation factor
MAARQATRADARIEVQVASTAAHVPNRRVLTRWALSALAAERRPGVVCLRIVDEPESRTLNARYRDRDRPTNVLSFSSEPLEIGLDPAPLGDVVLCAPVIARESAEQGKPSRAHWAHLTVHGVLHLLGYDHANRADARVMEGREVAILAALGFDNPYVLR